jgi:dTMP kinase
MQQPTDCRHHADTLPGIFISFEGIDGSGKSTLSRLISQELMHRSSRRILLTREPGGTVIGQHIRSLVSEYVMELETGFLLFAADRAEHVAKVIRPALSAGHIVVSDRFVDSSRAYQGWGKGVDLAFIDQVSGHITQGLEPHVVIYCDVDIETALARVRQRAEALTVFEKEKRAFYERVIQGYSCLFTNNPRVIWLDARQSIEVLVIQIIQELRHRFPAL